MQRISISVDDSLAEAFDGLVKRRGYLNRSEAFRDLLRKELGNEMLSNGDSQWCVAVLTYVYNHHQRQMAGRLTGIQHHNHDLIVTSQHIHLDHEHCLEMVFLRGRTEEVQACANAILAETGIHHGNLHIVPLEEQPLGESHSHSHPHY